MWSDAGGVNGDGMEGLHLNLDLGQDLNLDLGDV